MAAAAVLLLALIGAMTSATVDYVNRNRAAVDHIRRAVEVPLGHLSGALAANAVGEDYLLRAAATTGSERNALLSQSIAAAETAAKSWVSYRSTALNLPGEQELAARYDRDYEAGKAIAGEVLVPILSSAEPTFLPAHQVTAAERNRANLIALQALYQEEDARALARLDDRMARAVALLTIGGAIAGVAVLIGGLFMMRFARRVVAQRRERAAAADLAEFESRLIRALEFVDDEEAVFRVAAGGVAEAVPSAEVSVVATAGPRGSFEPVVGVSSCRVATAESCPAMRTGAALQFADSTALDACPVLAAAGREACSVTCLPISVAGADAALVQVSGPAGTPLPADAAVQVAVRRAGERVTMLRAFARVQQQASHDPLTGLHNRRSLLAAIERFVEADTPYTVVFADLDRFKQLNDEHGHEAGDRALRNFARVLRDCLRPEDLPCRWGGEEFVAVLPNCDERRGVHAAERVRARQAVSRGAIDGVTASFGVAESQPGEPFDATVARADQALRRAKAAGRDRIVVWEASPPDQGPVRSTSRGPDRSGLNQG